MLAKVPCVRHVPGTIFACVPGGQMLAKVSCLRHVPGTDFGAPGAMLAIG